MGRELAEYITTMARRFNMREQEFEVVLAGSVFKGVGPLMVDTITQEIHRWAPYAQIVRARFEPAVGSVLLALDAVGTQVNDNVYARLKATSPGVEFYDTASGQRPTPIRQEKRG